LLEDEDTLVVISTDLSHYYDIKEANKLDSKCIEAIQNLDIESLKSGCQACGILGVYALLKSSINLDLGTKILSYTTSAEVSGDTASVVGYMSAIIY
jgi:AmmeMemoRadiSam system protein B